MVMTRKPEATLIRAATLMWLVAAAGLTLSPRAGLAAIQFLGDGAQQNGVTGGWDLPAQGSCLGHPSATRRPDCLALRLDAIDSATCTAAGVLGAWATSGVCNDLVNTTAESCLGSCTDPAFTNQETC